MKRDIVADALNQIMNAIKAGKETIEVKRHSKFLLSVLAMAKLKGYIKEYKIDSGVLKIEVAKLNGCSAIKPRFVVSVDLIDRYVQRYLPSKDIGMIVVSTSKGLMTHQTARNKNLGGSLIAYFY